MLVIRLSRVGKKNHPQYKLVVAEKTSPVKGRFVEQLGSYDPHLKNVVIKKERVEYWLSKGAACSDTAYNILIAQGIIKGAKRKVKLPEKPKEEVVEGAEEKKTEAVVSAEKPSEKVEEKSVAAPKEVAVKETDSSKKEEKKEELPKDEPKKEEKKAE